MSRLPARIIPHLPKPLKILAYVLRYSAFKPIPDVNNLRKQNMVLSYIREHRIKCFIETGTYFGQMVDAVKDTVDSVYTIEIDNTLFNIAKLRFCLNRHVHTLHGNSGETLRQVLPDVQERCLFWLDAHYSGVMTSKGLTDTPVLHELEAIKSHPIKNHIILIDDVRCFGYGDYPPIEAVSEVIRSIAPHYQIIIRDDILTSIPQTGD